MSVTVVLNGETQTLADDQTLVGLLELRKPRPPFAVELNKQLVRRSEYANVRIKNGDQIEIVTLVGGG